MFDRWDRLDKEPLDVGSQAAYVRGIESLRAEPKMSTAATYGQCRSSIPQRLVTVVKDSNEALFLLRVAVTSLRLYRETTKPWPVAAAGWLRSVLVSPLRSTVLAVLATFALVIVARSRMPALVSFCFANR